jgi:hypothetical protein
MGGIPYFLELSILAIFLNYQILPPVVCIFII